MEKRAEHEAFERRQGEDEEELEDDEDEGDEEEAAGDEEPGDDEAGEDEEPAPKKKKAPAKPAKEPKKPKARSRTPKVSRMKIVWGVFNNSNVRVATYEFRQKTEADEHAARLSTVKKSTHFVQPVKEPIEEKKEA